MRLETDRESFFTEKNRWFSDWQANWEVESGRWMAMLIPNARLRTGSWATMTRISRPMGVFACTCTIQERCQSLSVSTARLICLN